MDCFPASAGFRVPVLSFFSLAQSIKYPLQIKDDQIAISTMRFPKYYYRFWDFTGQTINFNNVKKIKISESVDGFGSVPSMVTIRQKRGPTAYFIIGFGGKVREKLVLTLKNKSEQFGFNFIDN